MGATAIVPSSTASSACWWCQSQVPLCVRGTRVSSILFVHSSCRWAVVVVVVALNS